MRDLEGEREVGEGVRIIFLFIFRSLWPKPILAWFGVKTRRLVSSVCIALETRGYSSSSSGYCLVSDASYFSPT